MGNKFFKHHVDEGDPEYQMYRGMCNEVAEMFGIDFLYITRKVTAEPDWVWGEDPLNYFDGNRLVTLYIENFQQFEGSGDLFSKFGWNIDDQLITVVGIDEFRKAARVEPIEQDLLYHPVSQKYFMIEHIAKPQGFYQFGGGQMMYRFTSTLFKYSHENFDTKFEDTDDFMNDIGDSELKPDEDEQASNQADDILEFDESNVFGEK
jgi:hypothetical protein